MPALLECSFSWRSDLERAMIAQQKPNESGYTLEPNKNSLKALLGQFQGHPCVLTIPREHLSPPANEALVAGDQVQEEIPEALRKYSYTWLIGNIYIYTKHTKNIETPQDWIATFLKVSYNKFGIVGLNQNWKFIPLFPILWSFLFRSFAPLKTKAAKEHIITGKAVATKIQILDGTFLMQQASMGWYGYDLAVQVLILPQYYSIYM